jgi:hypothetical protein
VRHSEGGGEVNRQPGLLCSPFKSPLIERLLCASIILEPCQPIVHVISSIHTGLALVGSGLREVSFSAWKLSFSMQLQMNKAGMTRVFKVTQCLMKSAWFPV